jgi:hypothetical protein
MELNGVHRLGKQAFWIVTLFFLTYIPNLCSGFSRYHCKVCLWRFQGIRDYADWRIDIGIWEWNREFKERGLGLLEALLDRTTINMILILHLFLFLH